MYLGLMKPYVQPMEIYQVKISKIWKIVGNKVKMVDLHGYGNLLKTEYTFFLRVFSLTKVNHILGHKGNVNKSPQVEIV